MQNCLEYVSCKILQPVIFWFTTGIKHYDTLLCLDNLTLSLYVDMVLIKAVLNLTENCSVISHIIVNTYVEEFVSCNTQSTRANSMAHRATIKTLCANAHMGATQ